MKRMIAAAILGLASAGAGIAKLPPNTPIPKQPTPNGIPKVDPKVLKYLVTEINFTFEGTADKRPDGSYDIAPKVKLIASTPADGKHGLAEAMSLSLTRTDSVTCQDGSKTTSYTPAYPAFVTGTMQNAQLVATMAITADQFLLGGKCASGAPDSAVTTIVATVPTKGGAKATKTIITHMTHFNF